VGESVGVSVGSGVKVPVGDGVEVNVAEGSGVSVGGGSRPGGSAQASSMSRQTATGSRREMAGRWRAAGWGETGTIDIDEVLIDK
jgi:hypothetical protein